MTQKCELIAIPARPSLPFCAPATYWDGLASQTSMYPACICLCVRVCCVPRRVLSTIEADMALLSVSRLVCGTCLI